VIRTAEVAVFAGLRGPARTFTYSVPLGLDVRLGHLVRAGFGARAVHGVVVGLGQKGVKPWIAVSVIAAFLTFFPVAMNTLRGLLAPDPRSLELMRSYAAGRNDVLWKLRLPASLPFVFSALKISATASVIGAIIGETPASIQDGLGGAIVNFNQYYSTAPTRLWATNIVCAVLGLVFFAVVLLAERFVLRRAPENIA